MSQTLQDPTARVAEALNVRLDQLAAHVRMLIRVRSISTALLVFSGSLLVALAIDYVWDLPLAFRIGLLVAAVALTGLAWYRVLFPAGLRRLTPAQMAALVEHAHPGLKEQLLSTIELCDEDRDQAHRGSAYMREMLVRQTLAHTVDVDMTESVSPRRTLRVTMLCAAVIVLLLAPFLVVPQQYSVMMSRFFTPWRNHASPGNLDVQVIGGDRVVARGSDVVLSAEITFRTADAKLPEEVWLEVTGSDGKPDRRLMRNDPGSHVYNGVVPHVFESFDFLVESGRNHSRRHHVKVVDAPAILAARLSVEPPAYTGRPAALVDGVVGRVPVFAGSRLTLDLEFSKPLATAAWRWLDETARSEKPNARANRRRDAGNQEKRMVLSDDGTRATLKFEAVRGGPFDFHIVDGDGITNLDEPSRLLVIESDRPPELMLSGDARPVDVRPSDEFEITAFATDDVSLGALELHYDVLNGPSGMIEVEQAALGVPQLTHRFLVPLSTIGVEVGNVMTVRVRAADERPIPGPQEIWSGTRIVNVKQHAQVPEARDIARRQEALKQQLQELREAIEQDRRDVLELEQSARQAADEGRPFDRVEEAAEFARRERERAQQFEQLARSFVEAPLYQSLAQPARDVARGPVPEAGRQVAEAAQAEAEQRPKKLEQAGENLAQASEQLDEIAQRFDAIAGLEQDLLELGRLSQRARQLAQSTQQLQQRQAAAQAAQTPPAPDEASALEQMRQDLQGEQGELVDDLGELLERRPEVIEAARRAQLERLAELGAQAERLAVPQQQLAESMQTERTPANAQPGETAAPPAEANLEPTPEESRQSGLAQRAGETALQTVRAAGADSQSAREAAQAATRAAEAARAAFLGQLPEAARAAQEAADRWEQLAQRLASQAEAAGGETADQARQLGVQQRELADEFARQAASAEERHTAQQRGQQRLERMTAPVADELAQVAEELEAEPLNMPAESQRAEQAQTAAAGAQGAMQQAAQSLGEQQPAPAATSGARAAQLLRDAAAAALGAASARESMDSPVPDELGTEVANAAQQLAAAQQQLSQMGQQPPSGSSESAQSDRPAEPSGDASTQQAQSQPSNQPGQSTNRSAEQPSPPGSTGPEGSLAQAAQNLQDAGEALESAAQQLQQGGSSGNAQSAAAQAQNQAGGMGSTAGQSGMGNTTFSAGEHIEAELQRLQMREWGQLPGLLETEIMDAARKRPGGEYGRLIKLYFEEIARPGATPSPTNPPDSQ